MPRENRVHLLAFPTELGWMGLLADPRSVWRVAFDCASRGAALTVLERAFAEQCEAPGSDAQLDSAVGRWRSLVERMQRYAAGHRLKFTDVPLKLDHLTDFQRRIVEQCRAIRYGQTRSYGELALLAGFPRAARAVGSTMAGNRFPILVPCHRVINSDGSLGQYGSAGGVRTKRQMLALEGVFPKSAVRPAQPPVPRKRVARR